MQVALAWLLQRAPNILLIPGTSSPVHLRENLSAAELKLPAEALEKLDGIVGEGGARRTERRADPRRHRPDAAWRQANTSVSSSDICAHERRSAAAS